MSSRERPELPPLQSRDSRWSISNIPMSNLDPSPVDEEPPELPTNPEDLDERKGPKLPVSAYTTTNFLGMTPHHTLKVLSGIQKYSVAPLAIYLTMHYTNTSIIPLFTQSLQKSDDLLLLTRPYYQSFPLEPILIGIPIMLHVTAGLSLRLYRRRQSAKRHGAYNHEDRQKIPWPKVSTTSALGYALTWSLAAHVLVMRIAPLAVDGDSSGVGLRYFAHGIAQHPWLLNAGYTALISIASWHIVTGTAKFLRLTGDYVTELGDYGRQKKKARTRTVNGISAMVAAAWVAGGLGVIGRGGNAAAWEIKNWDRILAGTPLIGSFISG